MDGKSKDMEVLDKSSDAVRVLLVDDDKSCHLVKLAGMLQPFGCKVTKCRGAKDALDLLKKNTGKFDIMITERNLPDMELLQKVEVMNLLVIVMSRDGGIEAMQNSTITIHGILKRITMDFLTTLWQYVFGKNLRNLAKVQQPTNGAPEAKRRRFNWSPDLHKIFTDCLEELKKAGKEPTPKKIVELMEAKGVTDLTIAIVKSHKQKWDKKPKKEVPQSDMQGYNDKDGPSSVHVPESLNSAAQLPRAPTAMNVSSQHHIGAPQIMTQPSSSRQICNDLPTGPLMHPQIYFANNPQNQTLDEIALAPSDDLDFYWDVPRNTDTFDNIDFEELGNYLSKADKQIP